MLDQDCQLPSTEEIEREYKKIRTLEDITKPGGFLSAILKGTIEKLLRAEQEAHLGYEAYRKPKDEPITNSRNGYYDKSIKTTEGPLQIKVPRDREGSFEPVLLAKQKTFDPILQKRIISLYSKGMTTRDIAQTLTEVYGAEVSPAYVSKVTENVIEDMRNWQSRPLKDQYTFAFFDAVFFKVRHEGKVISKAVYTVLAIDTEGNSDVLGLWIHESEGAASWLQVFNELRARGVKDLLVACVDGLKGFPEAIHQVFPQARIQLCIVHQIRNSMRYIPSKHRKEFTTDLKAVYGALNEQEARIELDKFVQKWSPRYPASIKGWCENWSLLSTFFEFPDPIRKAMYTTNAVENLHRQFRKINSARTLFPSDDSAKKALYLTIQSSPNFFKKKRDWTEVLGALKILFGDRIY